jgi:hypothetical protein
VNDNLAIFLILAISIVAAVTLIVTLSWIRARTKIEAAAAVGGATVQPEVERLGAENGLLRDEVGTLRHRISALETIATDPAERTARAIEALR